MRTFLCFLWLIIFPSLFAESFIQERRNLSKTIRLLHELGPKECLVEVENATFDRFTSLPKEEIFHALKISYNSTFELFKKKRTHGHWNNNAFQNLMEHLNRQAMSNSVPAMSSELETLVKNFKLLDNFLIQQNFSRCAWEIGRNEILIVMNHFSRKTTHRKRHN
ncbi:uncharacterized protein LOC143722418 [Siphateles boraxobius]|uniref:uncharacterized protein LOC143722418 n=1 Tax=Siphateles boraxobius TaxID=180520 RepID=UPI0040638B0C